MTKILLNVEFGFLHLVQERLRTTGHEVVVLDDDIISDDAVETYEREQPDVFFWDPGAPIPQRFRMVERLMSALGNPPTVIFTVMPTEWQTYCASRPHKNIVVVGPSVWDYDETLQEVTAKQTVT